MLTTTNPATAVNTVAPTPCQAPSEFQIFNFESSQVRVVIIDGEPWFVGKDVTEVLGYERTTKAIQDHVDDEDKFYLDKETQSQFRTELGQRGGWLINEGGIYDLVFASKLPAAKAFRRWVKNEVLPSIRKTGQYSLRDSYLIENKIERAYRWIQEEQEREALRLENKTQKEQITTMAPKAEYTDKVLDSKGLVKVTIMAKDFGVTAQWLNNFLHEKGVQFKQGQHWLLYQKYAELNYAHTKTYAVTDKQGEVHTRQHTLWTEEGRYFIYNLLKEEGYLPDTKCSEGSNVLRIEAKSEKQPEEVKEAKKNTSKIAVKRLDTGQVYPSIKEAANAVGRTDAALHGAIKRGGKCAGTHWVKVEA